MKAPTLQSFRLRNFKAVRDSGTIKLTPLTALIGDNGSGKSSLVEGLETLQTIVEQGLDRAMQQWRGFEYIWNQLGHHELQEPHVGTHPTPGKPQSRYEPRPYHTNSMSFGLGGRLSRGPFTAEMEINVGPGGSELFIQHERIAVNRIIELERDSRGGVLASQSPKDPLSDVRVADGDSILGRGLNGFISEWQFVSLIPQRMGEPVPQKRTSSPSHLEKDGSNIADYLLAIRRLDPAAFAGIVETLQAILPYASDLQPMLTSELERTVYLQLNEGGFTVPGWLLSTGTLRILALLALLRHPTPPPLIVIEEIENGLDPRAIHLIVDEIRRVVEAGQTQIILTTHSPYLLDLLDIAQIVLVERRDGQPTFIRPADDAALQEWASRFGPGQLYTMDRLGGART